MASSPASPSSKPEIIITADLASPDVGQTHPSEETSTQPLPATPPSHVNHARKVSDPTLLSPILKPAKPSLDAPVSPFEDSTTAPPSPTLSNRSSVHWASPSPAPEPRASQPEGSSGMSSDALLSPSLAGGAGGHRRKPSNATITSNDGTVTEQPEIPLTPRKSHSDTITLNSQSHVKADDKSGIDKPNSEAPEVADEDGQQGKIDLAQDAELDLAPFSHGPNKLAGLVDPKSLDTLREMGGLEGLIRALGTNRTRGLGPKSEAEKEEGHATEDAVPGIVVTSPGGENSHDDPEKPSPAAGATLEDRRRVYGENVLPTRPSKSLLQLMWLALQDKVLILLSVAAVISLALGFAQDFGTPRENDEPPVDWVEGVAIMVAILIVVLVGSVNDWQKERQFKALNEKKDERGVKVIRGGVEKVIDIKEVVVGDIAILEPGEIIPCDGVFLTGHNVKCDESGATGESDAIKKLSYEECINASEEMAHTDCFMISGSKVLEGYGSYVVIAVGQKSFNGRIMMALRGDTENTPLQLKLNDLAELIAKLGTAAGTVLFVALMIRFFVQLGTGDPPRTASEKGFAFVNILIIAVTLIVVAVPEGLPLAVTLALAFATKRMTSENLLVRVLGSCETMANASVVCTDKTGTLTTNVMTIVAGSVGIHAKFVRNLSENESRTNANEEAGGPVASSSDRRHRADFSVDQQDLNKVLSPALQQLFNSAITINSTAFEDVDPETNEPIFVGSKTETALLKFAKELGWENWKKVREAAEIVQMVPFSSERKAMGVVIKLPQGGYRLHLKGASEVLAKRCVSHVVINQDESGTEKAVVETKEIEELARDNINRTIIFYANQMLRTISLCYRDFESWPPKGAKVSDDSEHEVDYEDMAQDMTLIGITGIEDPLRPGVTEAVAKCRRAGVTVKMCTGDNVLTAKSIATQCGIYTAGGIIMEGPVFRQLSETEMLDVVPRLQVLARSSPEDKRILVSKLKEIGEIVGVTGDGTNDGPALKTANVGFSMGIAGTEVAKEASDIILMDDNFASIVKAIMWGRCVNDAVRKFLQFQISVNITAVIITFVSAVASEEEVSVLSAVQLLWVNIIMDTFAALALATDPASEALLDRKPDRAKAPLFSVDMFKQIFGQATYQTIIALVFHFLGHDILGHDHNEHEDLIVKTLVFNSFVFAQIFNSINCRRLDNRLNIFQGITRNYYFIGITLIEVGIQILICFVGGVAFQVTKMPGREWGISIALGFVSIPLGALIRCIPNGPCERFFRAVRLLPRPEAELPTKRPDTEWNSAIERVRDGLGTFANVRGGRMRASSFVGKSRKGRLDTQADLPSLMTMVPTLIASSVGAGWAPQPGSLSDPANSDPSKSTAALWEGNAQVHPDTKPDDIAAQKWVSPRSSAS